MYTLDIRTDAAHHTLDRNSFVFHFNEAVSYNIPKALIPIRTVNKGIWLTGLVPKKSRIQRRINAW